MGNRVKTLRVNKFRGINRSENPANIDNAEMYELENFELTKDGTMRSRMGYSQVGEISGKSRVKAIYRVPWSANNERLYFIDNNMLRWMKETDGSLTTISFPILSKEMPAFHRYNDRVVFLTSDSNLNWFYLDASNDEQIKPAVYPQFSVTDSWHTAITASSTTDNALEPSQYYHYTITVTLGHGGRDGETFSALPGNGYWLPPPGPYLFIPGDYARGPTTNENLTLTASDLTFIGSMYGFRVNAVRLFRRKAKVGERMIGGASSLKGESAWVLLDTAIVIQSDQDGSYTLDDTVNGVITEIGGSYDSGNDTATIEIDFIDDGTAIYNAGYQPIDPNEAINPKAKYLARLHNRLFLANIHNDQIRDRKKVYFTYRGWSERLGETEIPDFNYPEPMLIFPDKNYFYCDAEDVEDEITAISTFRDSVFTFTKRCMFLWREGMYDPVKIANDVGCIANDTVDEFEGRMIWLGTTGVFTYDGETITNLSFEKMQPYIDGITKSYAYRATACVYDRKYFLSIPYDQSTKNNLVLVYDFDLNEWHTRTYQYDSSDTFYITKLYVYRDDTGDILYAGGSNGSNTSQIVKLEDGYKDNAEYIDCTLRTKYFDFGLPDIKKSFRYFYLNIENYGSGLSGAWYLDYLGGAKSEFTFTGLARGFILGMSYLNEDYLQDLSDEMLAFSLSSELYGTSLQCEISLTAGNAPTKITSFAIDWIPRQKLGKKYGG